jgi:hypothetical protein
MAKTKELRVGILAQGSKEWFGGIQYTNNLLRGLINADAIGAGKDLQITVLTIQPPEEIIEPDILESGLCSFDYFGQSRLGALESRIPSLSSKVAKQIWIIRSCLRHQLGGLFPAPPRLLSLLGSKALCWIPDFQHCYRPEFFSSTELTNRSYSYSEILKNASSVVLSSKAAEKDARHYVC